MATPKQVQQRILAVPFAVGSTGEITFITQAHVIAAQEIKAALLTGEGERLMRPYVGSPFVTMLFDPIPSDDSEYVMNEIQQALSRQCRYSTITFVRVNLDEPGTLAIEVGYVPLAFNTTLTVSVDLSTVVQAN